MARFRIRGGRPLRGEVSVPGDKSVSHRAVLFAALAEGTSTLRGLCSGEDNARTLRAMQSMGVSTRESEGVVELEGVGLHGLRMGSGVVECGNSGTTMRLLAGLLAGQRFGTRLVGDASLMKRPMARVVEPLRVRGAMIAGTAGADDALTAPISIAPLIGDEKLRGLDFDMPIASAQVKSAMLLSGMYASARTALREPVLSRDHTERMMLALGLPVQTMGPVTLFDPSDWSERWDGFDWTIPGDLSSAAFLLSAALTVPKSDVRISAVGINPSRTGLLDVLRPMRADVTIEHKGYVCGDEPIADIVVRHSTMGPGKTGGELLVRMIDEVPAFAAIAAHARGMSEVFDAAELRVKESDRISAITSTLGAFGFDSEERADGFALTGGALRAAQVASHGDHRIAMMAAVLGLAAEGETLVEDVDCVMTSFPTFANTLSTLGADIEVEE